ncbi:MAG TPA: 3-deoxy-manno-octulosonate cytidylyltransferase [Armatimonadetes bacterium]|jgi:3-deoxy-manno-octulosonate cytidylyltransferase (CMP-KDO synthetase)|nr:3-deoxy-manno-octulosonate cytidylyltransferase [Armatimonadota bacterium]
MRAVVIIPARYASTRLPGKPLAEIAGRPLIQHVYERASRARGIAEVVVATDDARIRDAVLAFGGKVAMTSSEHRTGTDRVAEAAEAYEADIVVNVQGDEPLIPPEVVEKVAGALAADEAVAMASAMVRIRVPAECEAPSVVKVVIDQQSNALYFSRYPIPYVRDAGVTHMPYKHLGIYAYRREFLRHFTRLPQTPLERLESLEQLRALEHGYRIRMVEVEYDPVSVDTPEDLARVRALMEQEGAGASRGDLDTAPAG